MVAAHLKIYYPLCLSGSAFNALSDHKCHRQNQNLFWEIIRKDTDKNGSIYNKDL